MDVPLETIAEYERSSARVWPCLEEHRLGGWLLRAAKGLTGRANTVLTSEPPDREIDEAIEACDQWYAARGLPVGFKLTDASCPSNLLELLDRRGYVARNGAFVMTRGLGAESCPGVAWAENVSQDWLDVFFSASQLSAEWSPVFERLLGGIQLSRCFGLVNCNRVPAACGLAVLDGSRAWLFDIATRPEFQRQGLATAVVRSLMSWAEEHGASGAALQVEVTNAAARSMYANLCFETLYEYRYRFKKSEGPVSG